MKPQDIFFIVILLVLFIIRKPRLLVFAGLFCFVMAMPLFAHWIFFTAERLVMYAVGFLFAALILFWIFLRK